uniref:Serpentine receptor class gamma n=1 Tax=Strongyloides venezuelensis TaxID=75913 RepID=A0A0K0FTJ7_STRVS
MILPIPDFIIILRLTLSIITIFLSLGIGLFVLSKKSWHHYFKTSFFVLLLAFTCNTASTVFIDAIFLASFEKSILYEDSFLKHLYDRGREA